MSTKKQIAMFSFDTLSKDMAWYPVVTMYGAEDKFATNLITAVRNNDHPEVHDAVDQVFVPISYRRTTSCIRGKMHTRTSKSAGVWTTYAFVHCRMNSVLWDFIRMSSGLMMILATDGVPSPISDEKMQVVFDSCVFEGVPDDEVESIMRRRRLNHVVAIDPADVAAEKAYQEALKEQAEAKLEAKKKPKGRRIKRAADETEETTPKVHRIQRAGEQQQRTTTPTEDRKQVRRREQAAMQRAAELPLVDPVEITADGCILLSVPGAVLDVAEQPVTTPDTVAESVAEPVQVQADKPIKVDEPEPVLTPEPEPEPEPVQEQVKPKKQKTTPVLKKQTRMSAVERFAARAAKAQQPAFPTPQKVVVTASHAFHNGDEVEVLDGLMAGKRGFVTEDQSLSSGEVKVLLNDYPIEMTMDANNLRRV